MKLRCPVCFARENDVVLLEDGAGGYYCVKCGFTGDRECVVSMYADQRKKFRLLARRFSMDELKRL